MMTNTHSIKDLELVEGALFELEKISHHDGLQLTNLIQIIRQTLGMALPEVKDTLRLDDLFRAKREGLIKWPEDAEAILNGEKTIDDFVN
ncbi:hypothetical protein DV711_15295 [Motiliproteus coralliicola]|uniref:Uncharacterized protein n=1 Tax=Motiliproteus coralliicola TaxID=2283196 RepID=A0A369WAY1_9GAMM|nr:hypothetical protein [Motiliproteus coralliicola]RDE18972.1 hypothetical protein DV711_15295 [Motiliproteus coralliicola]